MNPHLFRGRWITDREFAPLVPHNVFHRQLDPLPLPPDPRINAHILFRKRFSLSKKPQKALVFISADDCYHFYLNGVFVGLGPAPCYPFSYGYRVVDVTEHLHAGENLIAVHTLYQGLINRVWVSGDNRHGLLLDLEIDGEIAVKSDDSFLTARHEGYREIGLIGYATQLREEYDSRAPQVGFTRLNFNDSTWEPACYRVHVDYEMVPQHTKEMDFEEIKPKKIQKNGNRILLDFGACYVGYPTARARGLRGTTVTVRCGQELNEDGSIRFHLRANVVYEEFWILSGGEDCYLPFDYKSFRYVEYELPAGCQASDFVLIARHYPFTLKATLRKEYRNDSDLEAIWKLCVNSQKYGVQEVIQDCMEREKGFYVGDGCYTALTHLLLTGDDSMVRKLIDDAFASTTFNPTMVTCLDCSFMQEIAEYPLMLVQLILWHYRLCGDRAYLHALYPKVCALLDAYRADYEHQDGLLSHLDKWCVVEWPASFRDGYDVDLKEGRICEPPHLVLNAYFYEALCAANSMAGEIGFEPRLRYRRNAFVDPCGILRPRAASICRPFGLGACQLHRFGVCARVSPLPRCRLHRKPARHG